MAWPPSMPSIEATLPRLKMGRTSDDLRASSSRSGYFWITLFAISICSSCTLAYPSFFVSSSPGM